MIKGTTFKRTRYLLGTIVCGKTYYFTALPEFGTEIAARAYMREHARELGRPVYVWRTRECWARGVNYGIDEVGPLPEEQQKQQQALPAAQQPPAPDADS